MIAHNEDKIQRAAQLHGGITYTLPVDKFRAKVGDEAALEVSFARWQEAHTFCKASS